MADTNWQLPLPTDLVVNFAHCRVSRMCSLVEGCQDQPGLNALSLLESRFVGGVAPRPKSRRSRLSITTK